MQSTNLQQLNLTDTIMQGAIDGDVYTPLLPSLGTLVLHPSPTTSERTKIPYATADGAKADLVSILQTNIKTGSIGMRYEDIELNPYLIEYVESQLSDEAHVVSVTNDILNYLNMQFERLAAASMVSNEGILKPSAINVTGPEDLLNSIIKNITTIAENTNATNLNNIKMVLSMNLFNRLSAYDGTAQKSPFTVLVETLSSLGIPQSNINFRYTLEQNIAYITNDNLIDLHFNSLPTIYKTGTDERNHLRYYQFMFTTVIPVVKYEGVGVIQTYTGV